MIGVLRKTVLLRTLITQMIFFNQRLDSKTRIAIERDARLFQLSNSVKCDCNGEMSYQDPPALKDREQTFGNFQQVSRFP